MSNLNGTKLLDFRSDTVTKPTEAMRRAMAEAPVGDDVYGDDPSMNELLQYAADLVGMESAIYACSGTMGNLLALLSHTERGDGVLMGVNSHTWKNEAGNVAGMAGLMPYPLDDATGVPTLDSVRESYQSAGNIHHAPTTVLVIENTHNSTGGVPIDVKTFAEIAREAKSLGLRVHVDGARIFDAVAYFKTDVKQYASQVDSIQICLSKGLAAPMGSLLCGSAALIEKARRYRKSLGGAQRQSGIAAAAGLIALRDMRDRLSEDHANAALLANLLLEAGIDVEPVLRRTNMVYFKTRANERGETELVERCGKRGLLFGISGPRRLRMVTHLGLDDDAVRRAVTIVKEEIAL